MIAVSTSPGSLSMLRKVNTWYTIANGNWSDPNIWISNGKRKHQIPQPSDNVHVNHNVTLDENNITVNDLYVSGSINANSSVVVNLTIIHDCYVFDNGLISLQGQFHNLIFDGYNNLIPYSGLDAGGYSSVIYSGILDQVILNLPYRNLTTRNGCKFQSDDVTVLGDFNQQSNYEVGAFNLSIHGASTIGAVGSYVFSKNSDNGRILFIGNVDFEGGTDLSVGNPNVEFRGGLMIHTFNFTSGSGTFTFSTNNQSINCSAYLGGHWNANITVGAGVTVTLNGGYKFTVNGVINGTDSLSSFNNDGILYLGNNSLPMTTGVFNYMHTSNSVLGYVFDGAYTLPYNTYAGLYIAGAGIKSLGGNTTINTDLYNAGSFDPAGNNLTIQGDFTTDGIGDFTASAFCNITINGLASFNSNGRNGTDLRSGNPNIEFKGGMVIHTVYLYTGTGTFKFSTNNQTLNPSAYVAGLFACNILISGAIIVTQINDNIIPLTGTLNGDNSSSEFICQGVFYYGNAQQPMQTGVLNCGATPNVFVYQSITDQSITPGVYQDLTLTGGVKTLSGNVSVLNNYIVTSPSTLNLNTFSLTNP